MIPERRGERFNSSIVKVIRNKKISNLVGKRSLHKYVKELKKNNI